jgi:asparagine synthase (glutamine-hydrolysing)
MTVHRSRAEEPRAFFSVAAVLRPRSPAYLDTNENVAEELRHALLDTIRAHLVADVDVGVFLSAGLDSSTQAALVAESGARLRTVTLGFSEYRGTAEDEVPLAEIVAKQYGADHRTVWITRDEFRANVDALLERMDQPTIDGVNVFFVARAAAEAGLKVALSGIGGDELFGGYPSFTQLPRLVSLAGKIPAAGHVGRAARRVLAPFCSLVGAPKYAGILEYGRAYESAYLLRRCVFAPWELDKVLDKELVKEGWAALGLPSSAESFVDGLTEPRHKVSALEASLYMRNQLLRDTDWASMSFSLEVRVPFVDPALWARVAQLGTPTTPVDKRMMASAACPALPDKVLHRPKSGFAVPIRQWLTQKDGVKEPGLRSWARYVYSRSLSCS